VTVEGFVKIVLELIQKENPQLRFIFNKYDKNRDRHLFSLTSLLQKPIIYIYQE